MKYFNDRGFTLTETLVVIAIIGSLSVVSMPYFFKWRQSIRYKEAAWGITSDFRLGRQMAMSTNLEHRVEFDVDGKRYRLTQGNMSSGSTAWTVIKPWAVIDQEVNWATGSACNGTADINVKFKPNGSAETAVICIKNLANAVKYRVNINATSGRGYIN